MQHDICQKSVHLAPAERPDSDFERPEYRVSFSETEVVASHYHSPVRHAIMKTVKGMKNMLKDSGEAPVCKTHYIKTVVFWLV